MLKNFLLLLSIVSIFLVNIDFYSFHNHNHNHDHENCENHSYSILECEDCQYIDNIKNNLIDNSSDYVCKENFNFLTFIFSDFLKLNKLEINNLSRAPPFIS